MNESLIIYKASAGSGKTFTLAVEYIMQLLDECAEREFEHTLAVTFTNKATAEMKGRIVETLYGLSRQLEDTKDYMEVICERLKKEGRPLTKKQVSERAGKALTAILHDYSRFRVETIDAFFQSILRCMARELGLSANLQVELSHDEVINSAVDNLIETMDEHPEVKRWVLDYVNEQVDNGERWDISGILKSFAGNIFSEHYQQRDEDELDRISDDKAMEAFMKELKRIKSSAESQMQTASDAVLKMMDDNKLTKDDVSGYDSIRKTLTQMRTFSKDPTNTMVQQGEGSKVLLKDLDKKVKKKPELAAVDDSLRRLLEKANTLYFNLIGDYCSATLALKHLSSLRLLRNIDECARELCSSDGRFALSSTPALLKKMVEGSDAPFIFEKIGAQLNHVMIDEFQDTSHMQWENFKKLLFEKIASGGKGLLVGDIKQSIYRWRSGDWKILYNVEHEDELRRFDIDPKNLDFNFRSKQRIIEFNNGFFPPAADLLDAIAPEGDIKLKKIYEGIEQKQKKPDGTGYVRATIYKSGKKDEEYYNTTIRDMVAQVQQLHAEGLPYGKMAILVRTNGITGQIIKGFHDIDPNISLISGEAFLLGASTAVQMIIAALRILIGKNGSDTISEKYLMLHYLRDVLGKDEAEASLLQVAQMKAEDVLPEEFTANRKALLQMPLYILCERLYRIFQLDRIAGEEVYVLSFLDELQSHLRNNAPDIKTFLTAWDDKLHKSAIPSSEMDGIRILTIHKSKGLEFRTVLLPFCDWSIEADRQGDILWCQANRAPFNQMGALPIGIHASKTVKNSVFREAYETEHLERRVDALNMLYVAFTRAGANLYMWGKASGKSEALTSNSTAGDLIYQTLRTAGTDGDELFRYELGTPVTTLKAKDKTSDNRLVLSHADADAIDVKVVTKDPKLAFRQSNEALRYMQEMAGNEAEEDGETLPIQLSQREVGTRMHEVLSRVTDASLLDEVLTQARQEGIIGTGADWDTIIERIRLGFNDSRVASWFSPGNTVYNECGVAGRDPEDGTPCVLRPDRVIMQDGCITVIDYKFGRPSRLYRKQVATYMALMRSMHPECRVEGYLWYIMGRGPAKV